MPDRRRLNPFRAARRQRGLTQVAVSRLTGVPQTVISDLETRRNRNPTWTVLSPLAQVFGVRPEHLIAHVPLPRGGV